MGKVTLNFPNSPQDQEFEIPGLGLFKNNTTTTVDHLEEDITVPTPPDGVTVVTFEDTQQADRQAELEALTVVELEDIAKDLGVQGYSTLNKADLITAIMEQENI